MQFFFISFVLDFDLNLCLKCESFQGYDLHFELLLNFRRVDLFILLLSIRFQEFDSAVINWLS